MIAPGGPVTLLTHLLRGLALAGGACLLIVGVWLFVGDVLVLIHHRPQFGDGPFGVMVGPIFTLLGAYIFWHNLALYGLVKPLSIKNR